MASHSSTKMPWMNGAQIVLAQCFLWHLSWPPAKTLILASYNAALAAALTNDPDKGDADAEDAAQGVF